MILISVGKFCSIVPKTWLHQLFVSSRPAAESTSSPPTVVRPHSRKKTNKFVAGQKRPISFFSKQKKGKRIFFGGSISSSSWRTVATTAATLVVSGLMADPIPGTSVYLQTIFSHRFENFWRLSNCICTSMFSLLPMLVWARVFCCLVGLIASIACQFFAGCTN